MISTSAVTRYTPVCDDCGWKGSPSPRREIADRDLSFHKCGEHREAPNSTGGYRGILGGFNRYCVCGARYVSEGGNEVFDCPRNEGN